MQADRPTPSTTRLVAAFATIYLVWGSTYLAIRFAIDSMPPFLMAGVRFVVAGILVMCIFWRRKSEPLTMRNWLAAAIVGCLMLLCGNGVVVWSEQYVPSGVAALVIGTMPLWMVSLDWLLCGSARPGPVVIFALLLGLSGVYLLVGGNSIGGAPIDPIGVAALSFACCCWSLGSLYSRRAPLPKSSFMATGMEMICGGGALLLIGSASGEWSHVDIGAITTKSAIALAYLVVFGSVVALSAYNWLLTVCPPGRVATYAYVNPVIAVMLGGIFANEPLTPRILLACALVVVSVIAITRESLIKPTVESRNEEPNQECERDLVCELDPVASALNGDRGCVDPH